MAKRISIILLCFLACSIVLVSCRRKDDSEKAAEALVLLPKVQRDLESARSNMNSLSEQLRIVQFDRDQLAAQLRQLTSVHEDAVSNAETAGQSIDEMTAKISDQSERIKYLEEEIDKLNSTIEEQRTTISQQQATIAELVGLIESARQSGRPVTQEQVEIVD